MVKPTVSRLRMNLGILWRAVTGFIPRRMQNPRVRQFWIISIRRRLDMIQYYSGENFDKITNLALKLADQARNNGRVNPQYGYSSEDWAEAQKLIHNKA
jgi:1,2-phenylacetyl-CoA epoxidase catalytic subunit